MKYLRYLALLGVLALPLTYSQAQVRVGIGIGVGPGYVSGPPACPYGYYSDYPYGCAPYGYYSPSYFVGGVFIGAGPWFHGYGNSYYGRPVYDSGFYDRGYNDRGYYDQDNRRFYHGDDRGINRGFRGNSSAGRRDFDDRGFDRRASGNRQFEDRGDRHAPATTYRGDNGHRRESDHRDRGSR